MQSGPECPPCEVTVFHDVRTCSSCLQTSNSIDRDSEDMIRWAKSRKHKTSKEMVLEGNECYKCWETRIESFGGMLLAKLLAARLNSEDCLQLSSRGCVHVKYSKLRLHFMILILAAPLVFSLACCAVSHGVWSYNSHLFVIPCRYLQDLQQSSLRYLLMFALNLLSALVLAVPTSSKLMGWFSESTQLSKPVCRKWMLSSCRFAVTERLPRSLFDTWKSMLGKCSKKQKMISWKRRRRWSSSRWMHSSPSSANCPCLKCAVQQDWVNWYCFSKRFKVSFKVS